MTISSTNRRAGPYTGTGSVTTYPFSFKVFANTDVVVTRTNLSNVDSTLTLTTDYTVSLNSDQNANPGGNVILNSALTTGYKLTLTSNVAILQPIDLTNGGGFYPTVISTGLDKLTIFSQQLSEKMGRAMTLPVSTATSVSAALPAPVPNGVIGWDGTGTALITVPASTFFTMVNANSVRAVLVSDTVRDGVVLTSPTENAVFDAIAAAVAQEVTDRNTAITSGVNAEATTRANADTALSALITNSAPTCAVMDFFLKAAPAGWLVLDGFTIGNTGSGATYQSAVSGISVQAMFNTAWAIFSDAEVPMLTSAGGASSRGASASADWAAGKRMQFPDVRDRYRRAYKAAGNSGAIGAAQADQVGAINISIPLYNGPGGDGGPTPSNYGSNTLNSSYDATINTGLENRPLSMAFLTCIKL